MSGRRFDEDGNIVHGCFFALLFGLALDGLIYLAIRWLFG